jgi:hypothetical protein
MNTTTMNNINRSVSPDVSLPGFVNTPPVVEQPQISYYKDVHSGEIRNYNGVFEGPEKTLGEFMSVWLGGMLFGLNAHLVSINLQIGF